MRMNKWWSIYYLEALVVPRCHPNNAKEALLHMYVIPNISFEQIICVCAGRVKIKTNFFKVKIYYACYYCKN